LEFGVFNLFSREYVFIGFFGFGFVVKWGILKSMEEYLRWEKGLGFFKD
jgi:hypothetical protein